MQVVWHLILENLIASGTVALVGLTVMPSLSSSAMRRRVAQALHSIGSCLAG
jgi:hypothetical protein